MVGITGLRGGKLSPETTDGPSESPLNAVGVPCPGNSHLSLDLIKYSRGHSFESSPHSSPRASLRPLSWLRPRLYGGLPPHAFPQTQPGDNAIVGYHGKSG